MELRAVLFGILFSVSAMAEQLPASKVWLQLQKLDLHSPSNLTGDQHRAVYGLDHAAAFLPQDRLLKPVPLKRRNKVLQEAAEKMTSEEMTEFLLEYSLTVEGSGYQVF